MFVIKICEVGTENVSTHRLTPEQFRDAGYALYENADYEAGQKLGEAWVEMTGQSANG